MTDEHTDQADQAEHADHADQGGSGQLVQTQLVQTQLVQTQILPDQKIPAIHISRDFAASAAQLVRAHTDPELVAQWMGPDSRGFEVDYWDARTGGSWRYTATSLSGEAPGESFRGTFHTVSDDRIVQTFTWEGMPDQVALETTTFEYLGNGMTRMHALSLSDSFEVRDAWLSSGMETGVNEGYRKLDRLLADGKI